MSKKDGTAAAQAYAPASKPHLKDQIHAREYPGKKAPKAMKVVESASHNQKELEAGRDSYNRGTSANGSHKAMPPNKSRDYVGHDGYNTAKDEALGKPRDVASKVKHNQAEQEAGRKNSLGTSADGSHKGLPVDYPMIAQDGYPSVKASQKI